MRKVRHFRDATLRSDGQKMMEIYNSLPHREKYTGREIVFDRWLPQILRSEIKNSSDNPFSHMTHWNGRATHHLSNRPPIEVIFGVALDICASHMTIEVLCRIHALVVGQAQSQVRVTPHYSDADGTGRRQEFLKLMHLPEALKILCDVWNEPVDVSVAWSKGIWVMATLLNIHPYQDGNGRLARLMANIYWARHLPSRHHGPVPLAPLIHATEGNFEIGERLAANFGEWDCMMDTMAALLEFYVLHFKSFEDAVGYTERGSFVKNG